MRPRDVKTLIHGQPTTDGNKVPLVRLLPGAGLRGSEAFRLMDPFLLMDHFGPMVLKPGTDAGFPPHPHRGFQTLTYMMQGAFRHRDSTGGHGLLEPGGAQLMNAGSGIIHEEMPVPEHLETGSHFEHSIPEGFLAAVVVLHGDAEVSGQSLRPNDVAVLEEKGEGVRVESANGASLMIMAGLPLHEPIAHYGPFVMNTPEEIQAAIDDYETGKMGRLD